MNRPGALFPRQTRHARPRAEPIFLSMRFLDFSNPLSHPIYRYATMYFLSDRRYFEKASRAVARRASPTATQGVSPCCPPLV
jgi:hypothetical protein